MPLETQYQTLLDNLNTSVLLVDEWLAISYANPAAEALLKIGLVKLRGTQVCALFTDVVASQRAMRASLKTNQAFTKRHEPILPQTAESCLIDYSVTPVQHDGKLALIVEMQAIDRFVQINREAALTSLQDSSKNLIRGLAHEIKNPLGGIRGAAQLLHQALQDGEVDDESYEVCQIIVTEVDRLRNLVDRLLGPNQLPVVERLNVHEVVDYVAALVEAETQGSIALTRDYDPSIPDIQGDREQLIQALLNIARNAMQALQRGSQLHSEIRFKTRIQQSLTIGGSRCRMVCRIDILDNGPGVESAIKEGIFLPMISGHVGGTGLGLTIAQTAINFHDGMIDCKSIPGETCFSIYLPIKA